MSTTAAAPKCTNCGYDRGPLEDNGRCWVCNHNRSCPECNQGKHPNCTETTLDPDDQLVPCVCAERGHP